MVAKKKRHATETKIKIKLGVKMAPSRHILRETKSEFAKI
jgi:hypothetical protein